LTILWRIYSVSQESAAEPAVSSEAHETSRR